MNKKKNTSNLMLKTIIPLATLVVLGVYFYSSSNSNEHSQDQSIEASSLTNNDKANDTHKDKVNEETKNTSKNQNDGHDDHNKNTINNSKLKIEDFLIPLPENDEINSLKKVFTQISNINLEASSLKDLSRSFNKIDLETEFTVDRNELTGSLFYLKSKNQLPGMRYLHGQLLGEDETKFIQHLSFEYKSESKSFNEAVTVAQSLVGTDQKPSVISDNYIQWKISETHILWVKKLTQQELLDDPIYPHTEEDLGTCKIAIEQEIH